MDRVAQRIIFSFLREQRRSHSRIQGVCVVRRGIGGHVVEVGIETVSPGRKVDRLVLAGIPGSVSSPSGKKRTTPRQAQEVATGHEMEG